VTSLETTLSRTATGKDATIFCFIRQKIKTHCRNFCQATSTK